MAAPPFFDNLSDADWQVQIARFERMAARLADKPELCASFRKLAEDARDRLAKRTS